MSFNFIVSFDNLYESVATHSNISPINFILTPVSNGLLSWSEHANDVLLTISLNFWLSSLIGFLTSSNFILGKSSWLKHGKSYIPPLSVLNDTSLFSKFSTSMLVFCNLLIVFSNVLPYIIVHPISSILFISFLSINVCIVISLSVAVK